MPAEGVRKRAGTSSVLQGRDDRSLKKGCPIILGLQIIQKRKTFYLKGQCYEICTPPPPPPNLIRETIPSGPLNEMAKHFRI